MGRIADLQVSVELGSFLYAQFLGSESPRSATLFEELKRLGSNFSLEITAYLHPSRLDVGFNVRSFHDTKQSRGLQVSLEAASDGDVASDELTFESSG